MYKNKGLQAEPQADASFPAQISWGTTGTQASQGIV